MVIIFYKNFCSSEDRFSSHYVSLYALMLIVFIRHRKLRHAAFYLAVYWAVKLHNLEKTCYMVVYNMCLTLYHLLFLVLS